MTKGEGKAVLIVLTNVTHLRSHHHDHDHNHNNSSMNACAHPTHVHHRTGFDIKEMAFLYHTLHKVHNLELNLASPLGGICQIDPLSLKASEHEEAVQQFLADDCAMKWCQCTDKLGTFDLQRFQAVVFVGGPGAMMDFPMATEAIEETLQYVYERKGGVVAAIGHGVAALIKVRMSNGKRLIEGKSITANTKEEDREMELEDEFPFKLEEELQRNGADFRKAEAFARNVVIDHRIITGQNRNSTRDWVKQLANQLSV